MSGQTPKLKLIKNSEDLKNLGPEAISKIQSRNFWNSCPKKLMELPTSPCELGQAAAKAKGEPHKGCPWFVNAKQYNYCFWRFLRSNSYPDGRLEGLMQGEIAKLEGCSSTKIHFIIKEALEKLKASGNLSVLLDFTGSDGQQGSGTDLDALVPEKSLFEDPDES